MDIYEEDANLTYEQVWDEASKYIYRLWHFKFNRPREIEYDDFKQECAYVFWCELAKKYTPTKCAFIYRTVFKRQMIDILYPYVELSGGVYKRLPSLIKVCELNENIEWHDNSQKIATEEDFAELYPTWRKIALMISEGYTTSEICKETGKTASQVYDKVRCIKRYYANKYGIEDYQRRHLRSFKRSDLNREKLRDVHREDCRACVGKDNDGNIVCSYESVREAERSFGVPKGRIRLAIKRGHRCGGLYWYYGEEQEKQSNS